MNTNMQKKLLTNSVNGILIMIFLTFSAKAMDENDSYHHSEKTKAILAKHFAVLEKDDQKRSIIVKDAKDIMHMEQELKKERTARKLAEEEAKIREENIHAGYKDIGIGLAQIGVGCTAAHLTNGIGIDDIAFLPFIYDGGKKVFNGADKAGYNIPYISKEKK